MSKTTKLINKTIAATLALSMSLTPLSPLMSGVMAATLTGSSVALSDSRVSNASTTYTLTFSSVSLSAIKCIRVEFDTAADGSGSKPTGMNISGATFSGTSTFVPTPASWSIANNDSTGVSQITYATGETPASASTRTVVLGGITNGSTAETGYFIKFNTFNNTDCSTTGVDSGSGTFIFTNGQAVSLTVDSTLSLNIAPVANGQTVNGATTTVTTTDGTIPFGTVTSGANAIAAHDITVSTNAGSGYTVATRYTQAPTNGSHSITDWTGTNAAPTSFAAAGNEYFGYTTNDATLGTGTAGRFSSNKWAAFTTSNLEVAYSATGVASETTRVGYQVGISGTTPAGTYGSSTVIFTATPAY